MRIFPHNQEVFVRPLLLTTYCLGFAPLAMVVPTQIPALALISLYNPQVLQHLQITSLQIYCWYINILDLRFSCMFCWQSQSGAAERARGLENIIAQANIIIIVE